MRSLAIAGVLASAFNVALGCAQPAAIDSNYVRNRFHVRYDAEVIHAEPPPHGGSGTSTAYRYFDHVRDAKVIFRKRALHPGASIGMHVLKHDEVYYVVSGTGEVRVDDRSVEVGAGAAIFMYEGAEVGIWQRGEEDLVIIVAYPPARE